MQKYDMVFMLHRLQMHINRLRELFRKPCQFEVMGSKQRIASILFQQITGNCKCQRQAVERGSASPNLIHQYQTLRGCIMQNIGSLSHLNHEGRSPTGKVIGGADTGKYLV